MSISKADFGVIKCNDTVTKYTLQNNNNVTVEIIDYGGIITSIKVPDKDGNIDDITAGYETISDYEANGPYLGAIIGRWANRIHNGKFSVDGKEYSVLVNNGPNHLHGGGVGYNKKKWESSVDNNKLKLRLVDPDGFEGYPGEVTVNVVYELNDENELLIDYTATSTKSTPINLTNHAYFNLAGHTATNVYDHLVTVNAENYTPKNEDSVPNGEITGVEGTVFDLRKPVSFGERLPNTPSVDRGYDINFCVNGEGDKKFAARVEHKTTGRILECYTDQPGVQLYCGNFLDGEKGKNGAVYNQHSMFCLETQNYPDAINKPNFPNSVLKPGSTYRHRCWYKFITQRQ